MERNKQSQATVATFLYQLYSPAGGLSCRSRLIGAGALIVSGIICIVAPPHLRKLYELAGANDASIAMITTQLYGGACILVSIAVIMKLAAELCLKFFRS